jgi:hypothetical protein
MMGSCEQISKKGEKFLGSLSNYQRLNMTVYQSPSRETVSFAVHTRSASLLASRAAQMSEKLHPDHGDPSTVPIVSF